MATQSRSKNIVPRGSIEETGDARLERERDQLDTRLENGYAMINKAEAEGKDVAAWESAWMELLDRYEATCDLLLER